MPARARSALTGARRCPSNTPLGGTGRAMNKRDGWQRCLFRSGEVAEHRAIDHQGIAAFARMKNDNRSFWEPYDEGERSTYQMPQRDPTAVQSEDDLVDVFRDDAEFRALVAPSGKRDDAPQAKPPGMALP